MTSGSVTIPMGLPDSHFYGSGSTDATDNSTPYVSGNGGGTPGVDHTGLIYAHSSAPDHAMGDTDTASFIHLDQAGYHADMVAANPGTGPYYMQAAGTLNNGPAIPDGVSVSFSLTLTSRSSTTDHSFAAQVFFYDATNTQVGEGSAYFTDATTDWSTFTSIPQTVTNTDPTALAATLAAINAGRMLVLIYPRHTPSYEPPTWTDDFAYLAANFTWTDAATRVRTWVREVQRGDKAGAAIRTVQNNSQQNSLRNIGFR